MPAPTVQPTPKAIRSITPSVRCRRGPDEPCASAVNASIGLRAKTPSRPAIEGFLDSEKRPSSAGRLESGEFRLEPGEFRLEPAVLRLEPEELTGRTSDASL